MQRLTWGLAVGCFAWAIGCQSAPPPPPAAQKNIDLLGDLAKRPGASGLATPDTGPGGDAATLFINSIGIRMMPIEPGAFQMGSKIGEAGRQEDEARHEVRLSRRYHISTTEITQSQWEKLMGSRPWRRQKQTVEGRDQPASFVTYHDAMTFCKLLSTRESGDYRLPTEAEWEYACRAGIDAMYGFANGAGGNKLNDFAWTADNVTEDHAQPVARKLPNAWGLYDMHGNVAEWCLDHYGSYPRGNVIDPAGPATGQFRVVRGGGFDSMPGFCRAAYRTGMDAQTSAAGLGFRIVLIK